MVDIYPVRVPDPDCAWSYYCLGCFYALEGKRARAFEWLEKAFEKGFKDREWTEKDKDLDGLRNDPRYAKLLEKGGHNTYSPISGGGKVGSEGEGKTGAAAKPKAVPKPGAKGRAGRGRG